MGYTPLRSRQLPRKCYSIYKSAPKRSYFTSYSHVILYYRSHGSLLRESVFNADNGDRHGVPNIGIVITDGQSNEHEEDTINQADLTRAAGVRLVAVGITDEVRTQFSFPRSCHTNEGLLILRRCTLLTFACCFYDYS